MFRKIAAKELAKFIQPLAHFVRIQIIQELRSGELDVSTLQRIIGLPQSSVSQHLAILKSHHLIKERKEGRRVYYNLISPELALWLLSGIDLLSRTEKLEESLGKAVSEAREVWTP